MTLTVYIDVSTPESQEILRKLEQHTSIVVIDDPIPEGEDGIIKNTYTAEYAENLLWEKLNEHYGTDIREI